MKSTRVNEVDLLRFLAALAVVFYHYTFRGYAADNLTIMPYPLLASVSKYGYLGVQLFFMISGFVILMTAANGNLRSFTLSRILRLYPAYWACCTLTFLATLWFGAPYFSATAGQYWANMTMLNGIVHIPYIDGAYWSLLVELKFYVLVALVLVSGKIQQAQLFIGLWLIVTIAQEIFGAPSAVRWLLVTDYAAFFIAGATCFLIWSKGSSPIRHVMLFASWCVGVEQSINKLPSIEEHYHTTMNAYVVGGAISVFFAVMLLIALRRTGALGRGNWVMAGTLTYPLYLIHQNIGYMIFNIAYPKLNVHVVLWGTLAIVLVLAYLIHTLIEKRLGPPLKRGLNRIADNMARLAKWLGSRLQQLRGAPN